MPRTTRRPLTLHVSALSDAEYNTYTRSITELTSPVSDIDWEDITLGVREARGWIRGRYGVDGAVIDQILRYFCPDLGAHDMLTGGQFFAVLRLVSHAQAGAIVDESLVFIQANPDPPSLPPLKPRPVSHTAAFAQAPRPPSPNKPRPLSRTPSTKSAPPPPPRPTNSPETPALPPRTAPPVPGPNPFTRTNSHPARSHPESQPPQPDHPVSSNPFLRAQPNSQPKPAPRSVSSASTSSSSSPANPKQYVYTSPPLPPRKPSTSGQIPLLPPPRHASLASSKASMLSTHSSATLPAFAPPLPTAPIKPPKPPQATSPLIKQSLQAAKGGKSAKDALDGLSKERRLEVIKKSGVNGSGDVSHTNGSSSGSGSGSGASESRNDTPIPSHRPPSEPESFYDVAAARIGSSPTSMSSASTASSSVDRNPTSDSHSPTRPQFIHTVIPNTPPSPSSPSSTNPRRSKSLHHPSPSSTSSPAHTPPAPPPRRKRPESVQVTSAGGSPFENGAGMGTPSLNGIHARSTSSSGAPSPLSRHLSFSHTSEPGPTSGGGSVIDTLHRTFANLNQNLRPGPGFESARIKAEGRVWPGGYVKGLAGARGSGFEGREDGRRLVSGEEDGGFGQDEEARGGSVKAMNGGELERDELKLPVSPGEGWRPLG